MQWCLISTADADFVLEQLEAVQNGTAGSETVQRARKVLVEGLHSTDAVPMDAETIATDLFRAHYPAGSDGPPDSFDMGELHELAEEILADHGRKHAKTGRLLTSLEALAKTYEDRQRRHTHAPLDERLTRLLEHYERKAVEATEAIKRWNDDVVVYLRALAIVAESAGNASTHGEKNARLRGMVEQIETAIQHLRERDLDLFWGSWRFPDLFRSEYPVRYYVEQMRELERELDALKKAGQPGENGQAVEAQDVPF